MRSHLEFRSRSLIDTVDDDMPSGEALATLLKNELPAYGYTIKGIVQEDWGWCVQIEHQSFPLWIGCGAYPERPDGVLCFIVPSRPVIRRWFRRVSTRQTVEPLATALHTIVMEKGAAFDLRWWTEEEVERG